MVMKREKRKKNRRRRKEERRGKRAQEEEEEKRKGKALSMGSLKSTLGYRLACRMSCSRVLHGGGTHVEGRTETN